MISLVIRLCGMKSVFKLIARIPDLYLIATFRDPRGIFQSRNHLYKGYRTYDWVKNLVFDNFSLKIEI